MELKKGYKQTEVGVIPEDWGVKELGTVSDIKTGPFGSLLHEKDYVLDGVPIITVEHLGEYGINDHNVPMVSNDDKKRLNTYVIQKDDIVFSRVGSVDRNAIATYKEDGWLFSGRLLRIRVKSISLAPLYLSYYFKLESTKQRIRNVAVGQTMASLNTQILKVFKVVIPEKTEEQTAIAEALSDADALIQSTEKLIAKKRLVKQAAMQQLLSPKEGWEVKRLGDVCEILDNLRKPLNDTERQSMKGDIPYCGANGIVGYVNQYIIDDEIILMAEDGGYFDEYRTRPIAYKMSGKCWVNNHAHILKAKSDFFQDFIYYMLVHKNILDYINGGTRAKLNKGELVEITINIPTSKTEQTLIATILSDMDAEITALEAKLQKYRHIKQGMMQNLLTGKIRLI